MPADGNANAKPKPTPKTAVNLDVVRKGLTILILLAIPAAVLWLRARPLTSDALVTIDGRVRVRAEVAATPPAREQGLSGHAPLAPDEGMLFVFDRPGKFAFWMKDMTFPIDIIWIEEGKIADLTTDVPIPVPNQALLPTYAPKVPVTYVLEVNAGFAKEHGLRIGAPVEIE